MTALPFTIEHLRRVNRVEQAFLNDLHDCLKQTAIGDWITPAQELTASLTAHIATNVAATHYRRESSNGRYMFDATVTQRQHKGKPAVLITHTIEGHEIARVVV